MGPKRHKVWHWLFIDDWRDPARQSYVMDDFGNLQAMTYATVRISLRAGDA